MCSTVLAVAGNQPAVGQTGASAGSPLEALCAAASSGQTAVARELVSRGADVNTLNAQGVTAVILAVQGGHLDTAVHLALCGADLGKRDAQGRTVIEHAVLVASREASLALLLIATAKFTRPLGPLLPTAILKRLQQWVLDRAGKNDKAAAVVRPLSSPAPSPCSRCPCLSPRHV
jgi:hypothetical protein